MSVELRTPTLKVVIDGVEVSPSMVIVSVAVGEIPQAMVTFVNKPKEGEVVQDILKTDVSKMVGEGQTKIFQQRLTPDASIQMDDGAGTTLNFDGYVSNPAYSYGIGAAGMRFTILHRSAELLAFKSAAYTPRDKGWRDQSEFITGSVAERIRHVLEKIEEASEFPVNSDPLSREKQSAMIEVNSKLKPGILAMLRASEDLTNWESVERLPPGIHTEIMDDTAAILASDSPNFLQTLLAFCQAYQMLFVPDLSTQEYARLVKRSVVTDEDNAEDKTTPLRESSFSGGSKTILPISHVEVISQSGNSYRSDADGDQPAEESGVSVIYPSTPYSGGHILTVPGPVWLGKVLVDQDQVGDKVKGLSLKEYRSGKNALTKHIGTVVDDKVRPVLEDYAKENFEFLALRNSSATLNLPLDLSFKVGVCYRIYRHSGDLVFTGFLNRMEHTIRKSDREVEALTMLHFSHIRAGDFELPT